MGFRLLSRHRRAAVLAMLNGGMVLGVSLLTDYPGGVKKVIHFRTHRNIDLGLAAMTATMPEFFVFKDENEEKFFLAQGAIITAVSEMTRVPNKSGRAEKYAV